MLHPKIKNELQKISFEIFRDFVKSVIEKHPELKINISDESKIFNDLVSTIKVAQKRLKEKYHNDSEIEEVQVAFMLGFIRSNLNTKWVYQYIIQQSNEYKEFLVIKALHIFFEGNLLNQIHVENIYKNLLLSGNNLLDIDNSLIKIEIGNKELDELNQPINNSTLFQTLENYMNRYISDYINNERYEDYVCPIENYFNTKGITKLIKLSF